MPDNFNVTAPLTNLDNAGQYDLREMRLVLSGQSQAIDIRNLYTEFNIYEDILGNCISGNVTIIDSLNLLTRIGFSGNERLKIVVDTPTKGMPLDQEFLVYSVSPVYTNPKENSKHSQLYVLNFCSPEKLLDLQFAVQKAYKSTPISQIVADIMGSSYINTQKNVTIEETSGPQDLIIPNFHPLKAVDWLSTKAVSSKQNPDYIFFENRIGYFFMTLETLFTNAPSSVPQFIVDPKGYSQAATDMPDIQRRLQTIKDYEIVNSPDTLKQTSQGVFASSLYTYDQMRRKFEITPYSITQGFSGMSGPNGIKTPPYIPTSAGSATYSAKSYYSPTNNGLNQTTYGKNDPGANNTLVEKYVGKRQSLLRGMQTYKIRVLLNGNLGLTVGNLVDLAFPNNDRKTAADASSLSDVYSGRYLVSALRHQFSIKTHLTLIEVVRGSPEKGLGRV